MKKFCLAVCAVFLLLGCSSEPKVEGPNWIREPTRVVDNGYIVYVGVGRGYSPERAQFKAEGIALEDLANECSLVPKGARIEDRYAAKEKNEDEHRVQDVAYVKLALEFQECEAAKKAVDPADIRKVANVPFTEQLKKYQDLIETGEMPEQVAQVEPSDETPSPPMRQAGWDDSTQYYATRQYVAYQKEVVVLSPPYAYQPNTRATTTFIAQVQPATNQIQTIQARSPAVIKQPWSSIPQQPMVARPANLAPPPPSPARMNNSVRPPPGYRGQNNRPRNRGQNRERRRRERGEGH